MTGSGDRSVPGVSLGSVARRRASGSTVRASGSTVRSSGRRCLRWAWRSGGVAALLVGSAVVPAAAGAASVATVVVEPTLPTPPASFKALGGVLGPATYTLETGPTPYTLAPVPGAGSRCTVPATPASTCAITTSTAGSYWVVETSVPPGNAPSAPVPVSARLGTSAKVAVPEVPGACAPGSTGTSGSCTQFIPASPVSAYLTITVGGTPAAVAYTYDAAAGVLAVTMPSTTTTAAPQNDFALCSGPLDMRFALALTSTACSLGGGGGTLVARYGATASTYTSAVPANKAKTAFTYDFSVPSGRHWFLWVLCGGKALVAADPAATPAAPAVPVPTPVTPPPVVPVVSTTASPGPVVLGASVSDSAVVRGTAAGGVPTGTVAFSVCGPTSSAAPCAAGSASAVGSGPVPLAAGTGDTATASSAAFTPAAPGTWCFAAVFAPAAGSPYAAAADDTTAPADPAECVRVSPPPVVVRSASSPPPVIAASAPIADATTVHTGEPWAGSGPLTDSLAALGGALVIVGADRRRRARRRELHLRARR